MITGRDVIDVVIKGCLNSRGRSDLGRKNIALPLQYVPYPPCASPLRQDDPPYAPQPHGIQSYRVASLGDPLKPGWIHRIFFEPMLYSLKRNLFKSCYCVNRTIQAITLSHLT